MQLLVSIALLHLSIWRCHFLYTICKFFHIWYSFLPLGGDDEDDDEPQADAVDYIAKFEVANDRSESPLTVHMQKQVSDPGWIKASELVPCSLLPHWNSM